MGQNFGISALLYWATGVNLLFPVEKDDHQLKTPWYLAFYSSLNFLH